MGERSKWKISPQLIISDVTSKTNYGKLTESGSNCTNILTSGTHGRRCSDFYMRLDEVLGMMESVIPNNVSLFSDDFLLLTKPNGDKKDRKIGIVANMLDFPEKGIFSSNRFRAASHFYDKSMRKLGGKQRLVTTDGRESHMFISDWIAYLTVRYPNDEDME